MEHGVLDLRFGDAHPVEQFGGGFDVVHAFLPGLSPAAMLTQTRSSQQSAISDQLSAISHQPSAISLQRAAGNR
jgi:hypothetical protein